MFFITIKRRNIAILGITLVVIALMILAGYLLIHYSMNSKLSDKYEAIIAVTGLVESNDTVYSLVLEEGRQYRDVEIFDITKGKVIKRIKSNNIIQNEAESFLRGITGIYVKVQPLPSQGNIVRIPFEPNVAVQNEWLRNYGINSLSEVFIIFSDNEKPFLLVLDEKNRPVFYNFEGETDQLLKELDFKLTEVNR